jgi:hypothetical protein
MLGRDADPHVELIGALVTEMPDYGTQLDGFRPRSQDKKSFDYWHLLTG